MNAALKYERQETPIDEHNQQGGQFSIEGIPNLVLLDLKMPNISPSPFSECIITSQGLQTTANTEIINHFSINSPTLPASVSTDELGLWFDKRADRWQKETAIHSASGAKYLHKDYMAVITKGTENPKDMIPLILNRIAVRGGDWFFALESITEENPAKDCEDYKSALVAWGEWVRQHGMKRKGNAVLSA